MSPLGSRFAAPLPVILDINSVGCRKIVRKADPYMREKIAPPTPLYLRKHWSTSDINKIFAVLLLLVYPHRHPPKHGPS